MESRIIGQTVPMVELKLKARETVYNKSSGMAYQTEGVEMKTNVKGEMISSSNN